MVTKKHLLAMICDLSTELDVLYDRIKALEKEMKKREKALKKSTAKRKPGRPRKEK